MKHLAQMIFNRKIQVLGLIAFAIIGLSIIYGITLNQPTNKNPNLVINTVSVYQEYDQSFSSTVIQLNISVQLIIYRTQTINISGLGPCTFGVNLLNGTEWQKRARNYLCILPSAHTYDPGSYYYNIIQTIVPKDKNSTIENPYSLSISVVMQNYSNLTIQSSPYTVNFPFPNLSLTIDSVQLQNETYPENSVGYSINVNVDFFTENSLNLTYVGCSSPFSLQILSPNTWNLTHIDCMLYMTHYISAGHTKYNLLYDLVNSYGQVDSQNFILPQSLSIQAFNSQLHLLSNKYVIVLS